MALDVAENTAAGTDIGTAFTATDPEDDGISWSLGGTDAASFAIGSSTGQLSVGAGTALDYESGKTSYAFTVAASDGKGGTDEVSVTVNVTDLDDEVPITTGPDLVVESARVSDSTPEPGQYFDFHATIRNRGDEPSAATTFRYYQVQGHEDTISYENTKYLLVYPTVEGLEPGESVPVRTGATSTVSPSVYYHYGGCVDAVAGETDTENNCSALLKVTTEPTEPGQPVPLPDLVVDSLSVSDSTPYREEVFTVTATIRNQGPGKSGLVDVYFLYSDDNVIWQGDDTKVKGIGMSPFGSAGSLGSSGSLSTWVTAPSSAGLYWYYVCVEMKQTQNLKESDTSNNCSDPVAVAVQAAPLGKPDLVVESPTVVGKTPNEYGHYMIKKGEAFSMQATVRNQGTGSAAATTLRFYRSAYKDNLRRYMDERGSATVGGLSASGSEVVTADLYRWYRTPSYYYGACVDSPADEAVTGNNCSPGIPLILVDDE